MKTLFLEHCASMAYKILRATPPSERELRERLSVMLSPSEYTQLGLEMQSLQRFAHPDDGKGPVCDLTIAGVNFIEDPKHQRERLRGDVLKLQVENARLRGLLYAQNSSPVVPDQSNGRRVLDADMLPRPKAFP